MPCISASVRLFRGSQGGERRAEFRRADLLREIDVCSDCEASGANVVIRYAVRREMREFRIGLDDRGDLVADAILQELREDVKGPRRSERLVGIARTGKERLGLRDRGVRACEPVGIRAPLGDLIRNDDLQKAEQRLEVRGLPLNGLIEVRWDRDGVT